MKSERETPMKRPTLSIEEATMVLAAIAHDSTPEEQDRANALAKVVYTEHFMDKAPVREFGLFIFPCCGTLPRIANCSR